MDKHKWGNYLAIGLTALGVITAGILIFFFFYELRAIRNLLLHLVSIFMPFIVGCVITYLLAPVHNSLKKSLLSYFSENTKMKPQRAKKLAGSLSVTLSLLLGIGVVAGLVALVVPQLISSMMGLINAMPGYLDKSSAWLRGVFNSYGLGGEEIDSAINNLSVTLENWIMTNLLPSLQSISQQLGSGMNSLLGSVMNGVMAAIEMVKNALLGFIVTAYLLSGKERLIAKAKKILYAIFGAQRGNRVMEEIRYIHGVFGGFIQGKLVDSLIIGILCFVGASLLGLPYNLLISVVIGVTNVIPFFGPFIGAVPCALLILLSNPVKCIYFIIFILALQQFDGNILGPRILGNATGLSALGVLFSIIVFGGLFGFVGMIIGVPLFAVISSIASELLNGRLRKKEMSLDTEDYVNLAYVDQKEQRYVRHKEEH